VIETVEAYRAGDGQLYDDRGEAARADLRHAIEGFLRAHLAHRSGADELLPEVAQVVAEHRQAIRDILAAEPPASSPPRGR